MQGQRGPAWKIPGNIKLRGNLKAEDYVMVVLFKLKIKAKTNLREWGGSKPELDIVCGV